MEKLCDKCKWFENEKCIHIEGSCLKIDGDGRRPDSVEFSSMEEDAKRRDLTINGLFFDPIKEEIFDFVNGENDMNHKEIRFIGDAQERIDEDHLRMLRAIRFTSRLGFNIDNDTKNVIKKNAHKINDISMERIKSELDKMLLVRKPSHAFNLLKEVGLLEHILPEVDVLEDCEQSPKWHSEGNVFIHSMMVLDAMRNKTNNLEALWAALLHDIGKPATKVVNGDNISNNGHDKIGAKIAESILIKFRSSTKEKKMIVSLVNDHMKSGSVKKMKKSTLRKLIAQDNFNNLLLLFESDNESSIPDDIERENKKMEGVEFIKDFIFEFENEIELPKPFVNGKDLIDIGIKPGPMFRDILSNLFNMQLEGSINNRDKALEILNNNFVRR